MFQNLTTRRLGTRGQSRYHYYGLSVKPTSIYYTPSYSSKKQSSHGNYLRNYDRPKVCQNKEEMRSSFQSNNNVDIRQPVVSSKNYFDATSNSSGSSYAIIQQLPDFPSCTDFSDQKNVPIDKFYTLITMYRAHSQRILDSVNKFNFGEV